jgi:hypothetical protein
MGETVAESYFVAQLSTAELTDGQLGQVSGYLTTKFLNLSQTYDNYAAGLLPIEVWERDKQRHVKEFNFPVARAYWASISPIWGNPGFEAEMDEAYRASAQEIYNTSAEFKRVLERELNIRK